MKSSEDQTKKKPFSPPALIELTREQAIKLLTERKKWSEEEAAEFLDSFRAPRRQTEKKQDRQQPNNATDQKRKRSA
jgi:hypothetical protein